MRGWKGFIVCRGDLGFGRRDAYQDMVRSVRIIVEVKTSRRGFFYRFKYFTA